MPLPIHAPMALPVHGPTYYTDSQPNSPSHSCSPPQEAPVVCTCADAWSCEVPSSYSPNPNIP